MVSGATSSTRGPSGPDPTRRGRSCRSHASHPSRLQNRASWEPTTARTGCPETSGSIATISPPPASGRDARASQATPRCCVRPTSGSDPSLRPGAFGSGRRPGPPLGLSRAANGNALRSAKRRTVPWTHWVGCPTMYDMSTARRVVSVSLPPPLLKEVVQTARIEHRTMSELFREALRVYLWQARRRRLLEAGHRIRLTTGIGPEHIEDLVDDYRRSKGKRRPTSGRP